MEDELVRSKLVLARCINADFSDDRLVAGEYYLLEQAPRVAVAGTPIHQGNVYAYYVPDSKLMTVGYFVKGNPGSNQEASQHDPYIATDELVESIIQDKTSRYFGVRYRFELVFSNTAFKAAIARAADRAQHLK